ncbi:unnamed protein product [Bursaphelenchus xylophilus]|uniref:(pine wood nematode) hypothetical protein n=1 Tax=Bursaphelenchus xylophilus TaxID=6326 RepID=A0A1I7RX07_BURXY|nr:unnamed protein product [Bursaphelenchus xylophilus]CAG9121245.1 unnamed protein product [Bursaphelenchus xylophilus]
MDFCELLKENLGGFGQRLHDLDIPSELKFFGEELDAEQLISQFCQEVTRYLSIFHEHLCDLILKSTAEIQRLPDYKVFLFKAYNDFCSAIETIRCVLIKEAADRSYLLLHISIYMRKLADFLADYCWTKAPLKSLGSYGSAIKYHVLLRVWMLIIEVIQIFGAFGSDDEIEKVCQIDHRAPFHALSGLFAAFLAQFAPSHGKASFPCECTRKAWSRLANLNDHLFIDDLLLDLMDSYSGEMCFPQSLDLPMVQSFLDTKSEIVSRTLTAVICEVVPKEYFTAYDPNVPVEQRVRLFVKAFSHLIEMIKKKNETNEDFESTELFIGWALFSWHRMLTQYSEDEFKIDAHVILEALFNELTHDMGTDAIVMDVDPIPSSFLEFPEYFNNLSYTYSIHDNFVRYKWQIFVKISIILFKNSMVWTDSQSFIFHKFTPLYLTRKIDDVSASRMFSLWLCHAKCTDYEFVSQFVQKADQMATHGSAHKQQLYLNSLIYLFILGQEQGKEMANRTLRKVLDLLKTSVQSRPTFRAALMDLLVHAATDLNDQNGREIFQMADQNAKFFTDSDIEKLIEKLKNASKCPNFLINEVKKRWTPSGERAEVSLEFMLTQIKNEQNPAIRTRKLDQLLNEATNGIRIYPMTHTTRILKFEFDEMKRNNIIDQIPKSQLIKSYFLVIMENKSDQELDEMIVEYFGQFSARFGVNIREIEGIGVEFDAFHKILKALHLIHDQQPAWAEKRIDEIWPIQFVQQIMKIQRQKSDVNSNLLRIFGLLMAEIGHILAKKLEQKPMGLSSIPIYAMVDFAVKILESFPSAAPPDPQIALNLLESYLRIPQITSLLPPRLTVSIISRVEKIIPQEQLSALADLIQPYVEHPSINEQIKRTISDDLKQYLLL